MKRYFSFSFEADVSTSIERKRPSQPARLISIPASTISSDYLPTSPAERYVENRVKMLYDANNQQLNSPNIPSPITVPTNIRQIRQPIVTISSAQSLGFTVSSNDAIQPSSEIKTKSRGAGPSTARSLLQKNLTPLEFQPASASNLSTADYPLIGSSVANSSTFRTQMSHEQQMNAWRQKRIEKIQKKQRHGYVYIESPQSALSDRVFNAVILTPQIISTVPNQQQAPPTTTTDQTARQPTNPPFRFPRTSSTDQTARQPTKPPFRFPRTLSTDQTARQPTQSPFRFDDSSSQVRSAPSSITRDTPSKNNTQQLQTTHPQQGAPAPPPRMDRLDEDPQEISDVNKSTSVLIHRKDSQSSTTDKTEG